MRALSALVFTLCGGALAQPASVPIDTQATLFKKVLTYNRSLSAGQDRVLVVYEASGREVAESVARAFTRGGLKATAASIESLAELPADVGALYLTAGQGVDVAKEVCARKKVLSISGSVDLVERGDVSISLGRAEGGRNEIVVNLRRAQLEKQELASGLLSLARVIR
jgi:hypothetical protein